MNKSCCKDMHIFVHDKRDPIEYNSIFREYYINLNNSNNVITFSYCPWCGKQLPDILRDKFFDILEVEYNIDTDIFDVKENPKIPSEFQSDAWWKKRGL